MTSKLLKTKPSALDNHKRFMCQLTRSTRRSRASKATSAAARLAGQQSVAAFTARLRASILSGSVDAVATWKPATRADAVRLRQQEVMGCVAAVRKGTAMPMTAATEEGRMVAAHTQTDVCQEDVPQETGSRMRNVLREADTATAAPAEASTAGGMTEQPKDRRAVAQSPPAGSCPPCSQKVRAFGKVRSPESCAGGCAHASRPGLLPTHGPA